MVTLIWLFAAAANPTVDSAAPKAIKEKIVCRSQRFVGSHIPERVCKSESDWAEGKKNAKDALDQRRMFNIPERNEGGSAMPAPPTAPR